MIVAAPQIPTPSGFGCTVGKQIVGSYLSQATDAARPRLHGLSSSKPPDTAQALDYFTNAAARTGWGTPSLTEATDYELVRLSYDYWLMVTLYRNHWLARRIVDVPARDMVRAWPRLTSEIEPDEITRIDKVIRKTQTKSKMMMAITWARLFGGAGALMVIDGQENMLDEPLDVDSIEIGAYRGLIPFDRWAGIQPSGELGSDIRKPNEFNLPQHYQCWSAMTGQNFTVHASRILRFTGPPVPQPEYQAQSYWGISSLEPVYEDLRKKDNASWNILSLTYRANLIGMVIPDLGQALSGAGMNANALTQFYQCMTAINQMLSNQSMTMLPKDGDFKSIQYGFGGLSDVYNIFQMDVAGAAEIPVTRLFGRTLTGLGQSNDADERIYEEKIALDQDDQLRPQLEVLYPVICMSALGEVPDDLDLKFPSIRVLDQKEKADLASSVSTGIVSLFGAGIIDKPIALKEIKQSSDITEIGTNITDEDIEKATEQAEIQAEAALMGGAIPGAPVAEEAAAGEPESEEPAQEEPTEPTDTHDALDHAEGKPQPSKRYVFQGIPIAVEYPASVQRTIRNPQGKVVYDRHMFFDYGFIEGTTGRDGDEIDVIVGPNEDAENVYVVDMIDLGPDVEQREDEDKVLVGFDSASEARNAFFTMYDRSFFGGMQTFPVEIFREDWLSEQGRAADSAFKEEEHPRGKGEKGGQFVKKGEGQSGSAGEKTGASGLKPVKSLKTNYNLKKFRPATKADNIPVTWRMSKTYINPDPDGDVLRVGEIIDSGNTMVVYSKSYGERVKQFRQENWPTWALKLSIEGANGKRKSLADVVPVGATDITLSSDRNASILAKYTDTTGNLKSLQNPQHKKANAENKYKNNNANIARKDVILSTIRKDLQSKDEETRHEALAAALLAYTGARVGSGSSKKEGEKNWFDPELKRVTPRKKPADYKDMRALFSSEEKFADLKDQYAYVRSNFDDEVIEAEIAKLVAHKKLTQEQADLADHHLRFDLGKYQWPKWACELDKNELPASGAGGILDLRAENVQEVNGKLFLRFIGKESVANQYEITDPDTKAALKQLKAEALKQRDWNPAAYLLTSADYPSVTRYNTNRLKIKGAPNKSFRTMAACIKASEVAPTLPLPTTKKELKRNELIVGRAVARQLNNTPGMAISSYVDPLILQEWRDAVQD